MKKVLMLFSLITVFSLLLVGCGSDSSEVKEDKQEEKDPMSAMKEEFDGLKASMENGYYSKYVTKEENAITIEIFYISDEEYVYRYSDFEGVSTARCGIDGEYSYSYEGEGNYDPEPEEYCESGFDAVTSAFDSATTGGFFNSSYDINYSSETDYFTGSGEYSNGGTFELKVFKDGKNLAYADSNGELIVEVGEVTLP